MPGCREIDPLFSAYVDGEATADERALVDAHLRACPKCRHQTALQDAVRQTVRTKLCHPCAPEDLRARCRAAARAGAGPFGISRSTLASLSLAAAVVFIVGGVFVYSLTRLSPSVLAAQLMVDHVACFTVHESETPVDARASEERYARDYGRQIHLPRASVPGLQLVGMRRCFCGEGAAAHAMYRLNGKAVSLYVLPDVTRERTSPDVFGHEAVIWSRQGTTYVLIGTEPRTGLEDLATALDAGL
jgi:anti-sigma factor RsiW